MNKLAIVLLAAAAFAAGCSSNRVFVHALEAPRWPVAPSRTIGVVSILEDKQGRNAQLSRDFASTVASLLKQSAYYSEVKSLEIPAGNFQTGKSGEKIPSEQTVAESAESLGTELLLFVEVLDSKMWINLGAQVGYGVGFGRAYGRTSFGTSFGTGTSYWNVHARMLTGISLAGAADKSILARTIEGHSFSDSYADSLPAESDVFAKLVEWAGPRTLTYIDVYYHPSARYLRSDGTKLVADGIQYALRGGRENWDTAYHFWSRAHADNPSSLATSYDLGVASEIREDYESAVVHYRAAREIAGAPEAFAREIDEASHSADVLAEFGAPEDGEKRTDEEQAPVEPAETPQAK